MAEKKPRILVDGKDMVLSIVVVVVIMILAVGATGLCSYGRDSAEHGPVQGADAAQFLSQEARSANHEVR